MNVNDYVYAIDWYNLYYLVIITAPGGGIAAMQFKKENCILKQNYMDNTSFLQIANWKNIG